MKQKIIAWGNRVSPAAMSRLRESSTVSNLRRSGARGSLRREVADLREQVVQLRTEIDECRRDNVRITELTDVVENMLGSRPA